MFRNPICGENPDPSFEHVIPWCCLCFKRGSYNGVSGDGGIYDEPMGHTWKTPGEDGGNRLEFIPRDVISWEGKSECMARLIPGIRPLRFVPKSTNILWITKVVGECSRVLLQWGFDQVVICTEIQVPMQVFEP